MRTKYFLWFAISVATLQLIYAQQEPAVAPPAFDQKLTEARYELRLENGKLGGAASPVLEDAIAKAQYVLIGEDHITREIPQFTSAICDIMAPQGLSAMAVEASPQAAKLVSSSLGKSDRLARMAALEKQYPNAVAFLDIQQENDLAEHCAKVSRAAHFHLWGLDQEFVGSSGWLLDLILATHPGPEATAAITRLRSEEQEDAKQAKTGDPSKLFLFAVSDSELADVAAVLKRDANPSANDLFHELIESHEIYLKNAQGSPESNSQRARLMKSTLREEMRSASFDKQSEKILLKFGDWHLYKGFNPLHQRDLGNYVAEIADAEGTTSLHICILGAKGTHRLFAGYDLPTRLEKFVMDEDPDYHWLKPAIDNQVAGSWTLYDLRKLRFAKFDHVDPDMQRMIYGYDLLVIVPELTPADVIQ